MSTPQVLGGRYEVGDLIGRGGMAEVHVGRDTRLGRQVAIKMLRSDLARDPAFIVRFRREAQSAAGLNHASIVGVYDSGDEHVTQAGGAELAVPYIVMEYVEGKTLREVLNESSPLDPREAARITGEVLSALAYSHQMGIVHRDIKPANVMLTPTGEVKVMDFGIARAIADTNATMTQTQAVIGTAQYLSPEQAQGQTVDARSDLYSTGVMLFELLTGRTPFTGDSPVSIAYQHVGKQPPKPSDYNADVSPGMDAVVLHSLAKEREARYQNATAFRADVLAARDGRPVSAEARATAAAVGIAAAGLAGGAAAAGAGATQVVPQVPAPEPTEVMTRAEARARQDALPADPVGTTGSLPPVGRDADAEPPRKRGWLWALLTILAIGIVVLGVLWFNNGGFGGQTEDPTTQTVTVPAVVDLQEDAARAQIEAAQLEVQVTQVTNEADAGTVVAQDPPGDSEAEEGSTVTISVSSGPGAVQIPNVEDQTEDQARATLEGLDLVVRTTTVNESDKDAGLVVRTSPAAGESVAPGTTVTLGLSSGKVTVPNVTGKTQEQAAAELARLGFDFKYEPQETEEQEPGTVVDQSVRDELADYGATIVLRIATEPDVTTPPPTTPSETATSGGETPPATPTDSPTTEG